MPPSKSLSYKLIDTITFPIYKHDDACIRVYFIPETCQYMGVVYFGQILFYDTGFHNELKSVYLFIQEYNQKVIACLYSVDEGLKDRSDVVLDTLYGKSRKTNMPPNGETQ